MAVMMEKIQKGVNLTVNLPSFPLFCAYLFIIFLSGFWQKYTSPLKLRPLMILYNFGCSIASFIILCGFCYGLYRSDNVYQKSPTEEMRYFFWMYWVMKNVELLDTVFMILRHRQRQISFLHVYHHSSMLILSDLGYRMYPWPAIAMFLAINSLVHVVLYLYYGLAAIMPDNPPKWKKQLTQMQILQFLIDFIIAAYGYVYHGFCVYGLWYGITMTSLFSNFYYHAYVKQRKPEKKLKSS